MNKNSDGNGAVKAEDRIPAGMQVNAWGGLVPGPLQNRSTGYVSNQFTIRFMSAADLGRAMKAEGAPKYVAFKRLPDRRKVHQRRGARRARRSSYSTHPKESGE